MNGLMGLVLNHTFNQVVVMATADPLNVLLNYGGLGLGILLFITGQLHSKGELTDAREQRDRAMAALDEMRRQMMTTTVPTLSGNLDVLAAIKDAVEAQVAAQKVSDTDLLRDVLSELRRGQGRT